MRLEQLAVDLDGLLVVAQAVLQLRLQLQARQPPRVRHPLHRVQRLRTMSRHIVIASYRCILPQACTGVRKKLGRLCHGATVIRMRRRLSAATLRSHNANTEPMTRGPETDMPLCPPVRAAPAGSSSTPAIIKVCLVPRSEFQRACTTMQATSLTWSAIAFRASPSRTQDHWPLRR